jgi:propanediol utilization protein
MAIKMKTKNLKVLVEVSGRHVHLSQADIEKLFGKEHRLIKMKQLSQPCEFACQETVIIETNGEKIGNVRVVGPADKRSQVEISRTDARFLKIKPKIKTNADKGDIKIKIKGARGDIKVPVIIKQRHLHCSAEEARKLRLKNVQKIKVRISGKRALVFDNVIVRADKCYKLAVHLDTDEGNAAGIDGQGEGEIV